MSRRGGRRGSKDLPDDWPAEEPAPAPEAAPEETAVSSSAPSAPAGDGGTEAAHEADDPSDGDYRPISRGTGGEHSIVIASTASQSMLRFAAEDEEVDRPDSPANEAVPDNEQESESEAESEEFDGGIDGAQDTLAITDLVASDTPALADADPSSHQRASLESAQSDGRFAVLDEEAEEDLDQSASHRRKAYYLEEWQDDRDDEEEDEFGNAITVYEGGQDDDLYEEEIDDAQQDNIMFLEGDLGNEMKGVVEANSNTMLAFFCFSILWVLGAAAILLALTWHYVWVEVVAQADLSALSAVQHGRLQASEALSPATAVLKTLDLGFRAGAITSIGDYSGFKQVVEPFFQALPELRDVEMADTPEYLQYVNPGSVLATRLPTGVVELRSDRGDCSLVPGGKGCTLEPNGANASDWYAGRVPVYPHPWSPLQLRVAWDGPSFARNLPHEAICDELCWSPTYSFASRIAGTIDPDFVGLNATFDPYRSVIVRVTMEATIFIDVLTQVQIQSHGEALICTDTGEVVAAVEMADSQTADALTGNIRMVKAWEYQRPWASIIDPSMVSLGAGESVASGEYLVSAWKLDSPLNATATLGDSLRIVVAVPSSAFADSVIESMRMWFIVTSASPVAFILIAAVVNLYLRFSKKGRKNFRDMTIAELKLMNRNRKRVKSMTKSKSFINLGGIGKGRSLSRSLSFAKPSLSRGLSRGGTLSLEDDQQVKTARSWSWQSLRKSKSNVDAQPALADLNPDAEFLSQAPKRRF